MSVKIKSTAPSNLSRTRRAAEWLETLSASEKAELAAIKTDKGTTGISRDWIEEHGGSRQFYKLITTNGGSENA